MKLLIGALCCCLVLVSCVEPSTTSQTLKTFVPATAPRKVAIWMDSDGRSYTSKYDGIENKVREILIREIVEKGWEIVPSMNSADYGLVYVYGIKSSEHAGYSVYGNSIMEDRMYMFYTKAELSKVGSDHRPKETVWNGSAFLGQYNADLERIFPTMAKSLIENEFPHR